MTEAEYLAETRALADEAQDTILALKDLISEHIGKVEDIEGAYKSTVFEHTGALSAARRFLHSVFVCFRDIEDSAEERQREIEAREARIRELEQEERERQEARAKADAAAEANRNAIIHALTQEPTQKEVVHDLMAKDVAAHFQVSAGVVSRWTKDGCPCIYAGAIQERRRGARPRYNLAEVKAWLAEGNGLHKKKGGETHD